MVNLTDKLPSEGDHGEKRQLLLVVQTRKCPKVRENHMKEQGPNNLYPEDLIPFTRYPVFLVIDSKNSHAFKAIHNEEKGEPSALLLSPRAMPGADSMGNISQSTYFLTASMQAFCQLAWIIYDIDIDTYAHAENIVFSAMEQYEEAICTFVRLKNVWGQPNPFLRRLNLRRRASFPGAAPSPN